jgi:hypothetical protein
MSWSWLNSSPETYNAGFVRRIVIRATLLFVLVNLLYAVVNPLPVISRITVYNTLLPGRERFPYSDNPSEAMNLSLQRLEGLFASHVIRREKQTDEFRVAIIGDSSVWGVLLKDNETLSGCLNALDLKTADGRSVITYNLGYPVLSLLKDVLILENALAYELDAVIWLTTLQAFWEQEQLRHPIVLNNMDHVDRLTQARSVDIPAGQFQSGLLDRTLVMQRRELADWLRYQVYGLGWWMTGKDYAPAQFLAAPVSNLPASEGILNQPGVSVGDLVGQGVLADHMFFAGVALAQERGKPLLIVNEPIFISQGENSGLRYNEYYPRWAYDEYRGWLTAVSETASWRFLDLWDSVPSSAFTDTPFHYNADYSCSVAQSIADALDDVIP